MNANFVFNLDSCSNDSFDSVLSTKTEGNSSYNELCEEVTNIMQVEDIAPPSLLSSSPTSLFPYILPPPPMFADTNTTNEDTTCENNRSQKVKLKILRSTSPVKYFRRHKSSPKSTISPLRKYESKIQNRSISPPTWQPVSTSYQNTSLIYSSSRRQDSSGIRRRGMGAYCNKQVPRVVLRREASTSRWHCEDRSSSSRNKFTRTIEEETMCSTRKYISCLPPSPTTSSRKRYISPLPAPPRRFKVTRS